MLILVLKFLKSFKLVKLSLAVKMRDLHVHAVDRKLSVTLGPERQMTMTVSPRKIRDSTNDPERVGFTLVVNATSTVIENRGLAEGGTSTWCMDMVSQQPKPGYDYKKHTKKWKDHLLLRKKTGDSKKDLIQIFPNQFKGIGKLLDKYKIVLKDDAVHIKLSARNVPESMDSP